MQIEQFGRLLRLLPTHEMPASGPVVNLRTGDALTMAVPAWGRPAAWKGMLNCRPTGDEKTKNKTAFRCQFGYQLAIKTARKLRNLAHPVPRGISLLGGQDVGPAQILLVDLMTHCWRTWDQVHTWLTKLPIANEVGISREGGHMSYRLDAWGKKDPIYALMVELHPEPARKP